MIFFKNKITGEYYKYGDHDVDCIEDATTFPNDFPAMQKYNRMSYEKELRKKKLENFNKK